MFKQHLEELTEILIEGRVPGWETAKAIIEVVEFQKRGLPHAHILVTLNRDHSITEEEIDNYTVAEIPDVETEEDYELWRQVTTKMIHGPCGEFNIKSPCCQNDKHRCEKCIQWSTKQDHILIPKEKLSTRGVQKNKEEIQHSSLEEMGIISR